VLPVSDGDMAVDDPAALAKVDRAALLLRSVRAETRVFMGAARRPPVQAGRPAPVHLPRRLKGEIDSHSGEVASAC